MRAPALQYYMHDGPNAFRFELAGHLDHEGARRLEQDWRTASSTLGDRRRIIDMTLVTGVDEQGHALITRWHREGAWFIANSKGSRALTEGILGEPVPEPPPNADNATYSDGSRAPLRVPAATLVLLTTMAFPIEANAATSKSKTLTARTHITRYAVVPGSAAQVCGAAAAPHGYDHSFGSQLQYPHTARARTWIW